MTKQQVVKEIIQTNDIETVSGRVKKDLVWVLVSVVLSVGIGLGVGSLFNF